MEQEHSVHTIKVDEYTEVILKIPKVLTAIDFKGLTMKANKLFNLSNMDEISRPVVTSSYKSMTQDQLDTLISMYKKRKTTGEISKKIEVPSTKVSQKIYYLKSRGVLK